ncbi:MAG TPA: NAD-dependent epimerase/dehydratase family protein [Acidimicrobiales bacterium]|nr:NAD-dependent epimerase/dehydratase family protein [Acidimicrobiales bacterium]
MADSDLTVVTGAGGFIGGHLVGALLADGIAVRAVDVKPLPKWCQVHFAAQNVVHDLTQLDACRDVVTGDVGTVYNLAADMGGMGFIESNRALCMLSVLINTHMLMAAREAGVERFFYSSSACVYAAEHQRSPEVTALEESAAYPAEPEDGYGWEKLFSERMSRHFREDFGLATRMARYHNVYGPLGTYEGGREKAPAAICRKVAHASLTGRHEIEIWGDGKQTRSFTYIDDCVHGTRLIAGGEYAEPLNLGSSELVTVDELVSMVESIAGVMLERHYDLSAPQGVRGRNSDNTLIRSVFGWEPATSLLAGMEKTYEWIYGEIKRSL